MPDQSESEIQLEMLNQKVRRVEGRLFDVQLTGWLSFLVLCAIAIKLWFFA